MSMTMVLVAVRPGQRGGARMLPSRLLLRASGLASQLDLGKAWHALHFLLCGSAGEAPLPGGFLLSGGEEFGSDDGYGPPRWFAPEQVAAIVPVVAGLSDEVLAGRYDGPAMQAAMVYGGNWAQRDVELPELLQRAAALRAFVEQAGRSGRGLVVLLS
jgi:Domain of unknown function (DUF1877)